MAIPDPVRDSQFYEGVPLRRFVAFVVDFIIITVLGIVGAFIVALGTFGLGTPLMFLIITLTGFLYRWLLLKHRSATIGMIMTGIEIRTASGEKMDQSSAFLHTLAYLVTFFFTPLMLIGWFLMLSDPHKRAMHDLVLGSVAINRPT
ncbi:MAG: RDD family protein [Pseudomonadota bacterium]